jgi:hypothetical protein
MGNAIVLPRGCTQHRSKHHALEFHHLPVGVIFGFFLSSQPPFSSMSLANFFFRFYGHLPQELLDINTTNLIAKLCKIQ